MNVLGALATRAIRYIGKNRWTWYVGAACAFGLACAFVAWTLAGRIETSSERAVSEEEARTETVLSNANLHITATGGKTRVVLDANGVPCEVTNEGGELRVEAHVTLSRSSSGMMARTEVSSSRFEGPDPSRRWEWGARAGAEWGRDGWSIPVRIEKRLIGGIGAEVGANVPIEGDEKLRRTRLGVALGARW